MAALTVELADPAATERLGRALGRRLFAGAVVGLVGDLGAGKTHLVRAIAEGLDIADARLVSSPTFVLVQEYANARLPIYHFDTYRLVSADQFTDLGVAEYYERGGVCLIEWADRVTPALPDERLTVTLELTGPESRRARLEGHGPAYERLVADLSATGAAL